MEKRVPTLVPEGARGLPADNPYQLPKQTLFTTKNALIALLAAKTLHFAKHYGRSASRSRTLAKEVPDATLQEMIDMIKKGPELDEIYAPSVIHMAQTHIFYLVIVRSCLDPRGYGSARTCSSTCTLSPAGLLHSTRRDPLRVKIREVGRGLSLADTQTGGYVRLYSRRRLCARRGADAQCSSDPSRLLAFQAFDQNAIILITLSPRYGYRYRDNTACHGA
jgi:hypothetical protein